MTKIIQGFRAAAASDLVPGVPFRIAGCGDHDVYFVGRSRGGAFVFEYDRNSETVFVKARASEISADKFQGFGSLSALQTHQRMLNRQAGFYG